jgi:uncharacterized protein YihD (DUF1040 family)
MRDPKRIEKLLQLIRCYWEVYPDLRLGQLIHNMTPMNHIDDIYQLEDDVLAEQLLKELEKLSMR